MPSDDQSTVAVHHLPGLSYPEPGEFFSPHCSFPEYRWQHLAQRPNLVYPAVRDCLAAAGLDAANLGRKEWNPLHPYIRPGQRVFVLCNFVKHNITRSREVMWAKCTHGSVVRAVLDYVLLALKGKGSVTFGNAPLQSCDWETVTAETGAAEVRDFYNERRSPVSVELRDLRQFVTKRHPVGTVEVRFQGKDDDFTIPVELGTDSLLERHYGSGGGPRFRVLDYDHRRTQKCHAAGRHLYLLSRHILESDVIISIPKLKTHEKVGITCGIKGCVGAVAQKDCLAHHRFGSPRQGGDEYPDRWSVLQPLSVLHDLVYSRDPGAAKALLHILDCNLRKVARRFTRCLGGAWPGNDTCWRMAVDLARIVEYADKQGKMQPARQRRHLMLTDGIVAGEGNGPLSPRPVPLGYLSFADNVVWGDYVDCLAMGYDPAKLPMISEACRIEQFPLVRNPSAQVDLRLNGLALSSEKFRGEFPRRFIPAREWRNYL